MKLYINNDLINQCKLFREIIWTDKFFTSGKNIMNLNNEDICVRDKEKHRFSKLFGYGYRLEDTIEEEYVEMEA